MMYKIGAILRMSGASVSVEKPHSNCFINVQAMCVTISERLTRSLDTVGYTVNYGNINACS